MLTNATTSTAPGGPTTTDTQAWSYRVEDDSTEDKHSFLLKAKVGLTKRRAKVLWGGGGGRPTELGLVLSQNNSGLYNRSLSNHTLIFAEDNNSTEYFAFTAGQNPPCYTRDIAAAAGHVVFDVVNAHPVDTRLPCYGYLDQLPEAGGIRLCGTEFCGFRRL